MNPFVEIVSPRTRKTLLLSAGCVIVALIILLIPSPNNAYWHGVGMVAIAVCWIFARAYIWRPAEVP